MNIGILPTTYPNIYNNNSAIFVQDQAEALVKNGVGVTVIGAIPISFKYIWSLKLFKFGYFMSSKNGVEIKLILYPSIPKLKYFNNFIRDILNKNLLKNHYLNNKIDLIHVHNATAGNAALWFKNNFNIPYCITEHSSAYARNLVSKKKIKNFQNIIIQNNFIPFRAIKSNIKPCFHKLPNDIYPLIVFIMPNEYNIRFILR